MRRRERGRNDGCRLAGRARRVGDTRAKQRPEGKGQIGAEVGDGVGCSAVRIEPGEVHVVDGSLDRLGDGGRATSGQQVGEFGQVEDLLPPTPGREQANLKPGQRQRCHLAAGAQVSQQLVSTLPVLVPESKVKVTD